MSAGPPLRSARITWSSWGRSVRMLRRAGPTRQAALRSAGTVATWRRNAGFIGLRSASDVRCTNPRRLAISTESARGSTTPADAASAGCLAAPRERAAHAAQGSARAKRRRLRPHGSARGDRDCAGRRATPVPTVGWASGPRMRSALIGLVLCQSMHSKLMTGKFTAPSPVVMAKLCSPVTSALASPVGATDWHPASSNASPINGFEGAVRSRRWNGSIEAHNPSKSPGCATNFLTRAFWCQRVLRSGEAAGAYLIQIAHDGAARDSEGIGDLLLQHALPEREPGHGAGALRQVRENRS